MRAQIVTFAMAMVFGGALAAQAQHVGNRVVLLKVDLVTKTYSLENLDGTPVKDAGRQQAGLLVTNNEIFLSKNNIVQLYVVKANPLVYGYKSEKGELVETADYQAVTSFSTVVETLVQSFSAASAAGQAAAPAPNAGATPGQTPPTPVSADSDVVDIFTNHGIPDLDTENSFFADLQKSIQDLEQKTSQLPSLFAQAKTDQTHVRALVCSSEACTWDLDTIGPTINSHFAILKAIRTDLIKQTNKPGVRNDPVNAVVTEVLSQESDVTNALSTAQSFVEAVARINQDVLLDDQVAYDPSHNLPVFVTQTELGLDGKPSANALKYTFTFKPDSPVTYGFGAGVAYSFVRSHAFTAVKNGDQLVIADNAAGASYVGQKITGLLTISPTRWVDTPFTPSAEIGINPEKDKIGLFFGVGFSPYSLFYFGVGFTAQQVPELQKGQVVGQTILSPDDIMTQPKFHTGAYVHVSVVKKLGGS